MKFELPAPPSANRMWRRSGHRIHKSTEYMKWMEASQRIIYPLTQNKPKLEGDLRVIIEARPKDYRIRDLDNYAKPIIDCMEGLVFINDRQVVEIIMRRIPPDGGLHDVLVEVEEL